MNEVNAAHFIFNFVKCYKQTSAILILTLNVWTSMFEQKVQV